MEFYKQVLLGKRDSWRSYRGRRNVTFWIIYCQKGEINITE